MYDFSRSDAAAIARYEAWWLEDDRPEPAPAGSCAYCGCEITEGDEVYEADGTYFCIDCVERIDICEDEDGTVFIDDERFYDVRECECGTKIEDISDNEVFVIDGVVYCGECMSRTEAEAEEPYDPRCEPEYCEDR